MNQQSNSITTTIFIGSSLTILGLIYYTQKIMKDLLQGKNMKYKNNANVCFDYSVEYKGEKERLESDLKHVVKEICQGWENRPENEMIVKVISGGITNLLYRVSHKKEHVLVRLYGEKTEMLIDRNVDNYIFAELSKLGYAPIYYGRFANGRIEQWLESAPLEPEKMGQIKPVNFFSLIIKELGKLHLMNISVEKTPKLWSTLDKFLEIASSIEFPNEPSKQKALEDLNLPKMTEEVQWLKSVLPSEFNNHGQGLIDNMMVDSITKKAHEFVYNVVFCHNDLLSGNILHHDDWDHVRVVDYEYGFYNYRGFDLANHFNEHCGFDCVFEKLYPGREKQMKIFEEYLLVTASDLHAELKQTKELDRFLEAMYTAVNSFALVSHLFWGSWAIVQAKYSPIDFDFLGYSASRFGGYRYHKPMFSGLKQ